MAMNVCVLMGRLTADPELRQTGSGNSVTSFTVAVDRQYAKEEKQADFINVVAWRKTAEFVKQYFKKGQMIAVEGTHSDPGNTKVRMAITAQPLKWSPTISVFAETISRSAVKPPINQHRRPQQMIQWKEKMISPSK